MTNNEKIEQMANEIKEVKQENARLTAKLGQVLLSIDTVKEMNAMCNIAAQVKQAKIDVLNELWEKVKDKGVDYKIGMRALSEEIDELIEEIEK